MNAKRIGTSLHAKYQASSLHTCRSIYLWSSFESDFIRVTNQGYLHEFEIKISKDDYMRDFAKGAEGRRKHHLIKKGDSPLANFSFVCPEGIIDPKCLPEWAGLFYVGTDFKLKQIKKPPRLRDAEKINHKHLKKIEFLNAQRWVKLLMMVG